MKTALLVVFIPFLFVAGSSFAQGQARTAGGIGDGGCLQRRVLAAHRRGPDACQPFMHVQAPLTDTDGSIFIQYDLMLGAKSSQSAIFNYQAF